MEVESTVTDQPAVVAAPPSNPLIRSLASCSTAARSKSVRELTNWLPSQLSISDDEMKRVWKGLFYCIWHADKAPVQSNLIDKLSSLLLQLDINVSISYLSVFLTTVRREWSGIDVLRLDKFYLLIRRFVNASFKLMKLNGWDLDLCKRVMNVYEDKSLLANDRKFLGNGVNYHIVSVFVDELKEYLPVTCEVYEVLFKVFFGVLSVSRDKVLVGKVKGNVFDKLLGFGKALLEIKKNGESDEDVDSEVVNLGPVALKMGFAGMCYETGSSSECFQGNRKVLFGLQKEFLKLEKEMGASGVEVSFPDVEVENGDEEVPDLVPILGDDAWKDGSGLLLEAAESDEGGAKKASKKNKKKKGKKSKAVKDGSDSQEHEMMEENENGTVVVANGESVSNGVTSNGSDVTFTELFKSNLQMEFEKIADEEGLDKDGESSLQDLSTMTISKAPKKRKRVRSAEARQSHNADLSEQGGTAMKSGEKSAKRVRFSIKNNLVWKPQTPLPPQSLRIPPSVTPRGSALKQGVPPGPIREMHPAVKRVKKKKVRKVKTTSAIKRLRKLQTIST
uniref:ribosomal RNA processing protein 1 homolog n=1 Tax=Erigeron canadensis TaxID=72917 RepID=UPI001CB955B2|nr:ribosomal RNA processing protein 1 homolog [Erigeron canadensis]